MIYSLPPKVGDTLKAIVTPDGATGVTYQWYADDAKIAGETTATYLVKPTDVSKRFSVEATVDGETVMSEKTTAVGVDASINEVKLSNTAPKVGDEIIAYAYDENGNDISDQVTWQWYRTTLASGQQNPISNATKQAYTITSMDSAGTVYVWATDAQGNKIKSSEAEIVKFSDITEIKIEGMSGKKIYSKVNDVAAVGDTLSVDLGSALSDLSFQWYRGGAAINGATAPLYTVVEDDLDSDLCVKIQIPGTQSYYFDKDCKTNADGIYYDANGTTQLRTSESTVYVNINTKRDDRGPIALDISKIDMELSQKDAVVGKKIIAKVPVDKNGDGDTNDANDKLNDAGANQDADFAWYRGDVKPELKIASGASYTPSSDDLGEKLICVATALDEKQYTLSTYATTPEVHYDVTTVEIGGVVPDEYNSSAIHISGLAAGARTYLGSELRAYASDDAGNDLSDKVSFQWYRGGSAIPGATGQVYTLTTDDVTDEFLGSATAGTIPYSVEVEATAANTTGAASSTDVNLNCDAAAADTAKLLSLGLFKKLPYARKNADRGAAIATTSDTLNTAAQYNVGDTLTVVSVPAMAADENAKNITWYYIGNDGLLKQKAGQSFKIPANIKPNTEVIVTWKDSTDANATFTIDNGIAGATLTNDMVTNNNAGHAVAINNDDHNITVNATDVNGVDAFLSLEAPTLKYTNGQAKTSATYREYPEAEVGCTVIAESTTPGVEYSWNGGAYGAVTEYTIPSSKVGKEIKCKIRLTTPDETYKTSEAETKSNKVNLSSRTLDKILITREACDTPQKFNKAVQATKINLNTRYYVYALDNEGNLVSEHDLATQDGLVYSWYDEEKSIDHTDVTSDMPFTSVDLFKAGQKLVIDIIPDGIMYTGEPIEYAFRTAVGGDAEEPVALTPGVAITAQGANKFDGTAKTFAAAEAMTFKASLQNVSGVAVSWYVDNALVDVTNGEFSTAGVTAGKKVQARITVDGSTYASESWTAEARAATSIRTATTTATASVANPATWAANDTVQITLNGITDQFGELLAIGEAAPTFTVTATKTETGNAITPETGANISTAAGANIATAAGRSVITFTCKTSQTEDVIYTITSSTGETFTITVDVSALTQTTTATNPGITVSAVASN